MREFLINLDLFLFNFINRWYEFIDNRKLEGEAVYVELEDLR